MDNKVELGKILGPAGLTAGKDLGCGKVFQVFMIHDHVDWSTGTFEEVSPDMESLKDTLVGQPGKQNHNVGIIGNEAVVKISKAKK